MEPLRIIFSSGESLATTIDFKKDGWRLEALRAHPLFVGKKFPDVFLDNFHTIFAFAHDKDVEKIVTPDGKSVEDWQANQRPCLLKPNDRQEAQFYREWKGWVKNDLLLNYEGWYDCADEERLEDKKGCIGMMTMNAMGPLAMCTDEQMLRYQQEYWRETIYSVLSSEDSDEDDEDAGMENSEGLVVNIGLRPVPRTAEDSSDGENEESASAEDANAKDGAKVKDN